MKIVKSCKGVPVRLTPERTEDIERRHPEMTGEGERILETLSGPNFVQDGDAERSYGSSEIVRQKGCTVGLGYDGDADTLYISFGKPKPALGVDVGEGVIVRYDEKAREVVGLTLIDVGKRLEEYMKRSA
jgi:uncharacterized protein YuzE